MTDSATNEMIAKMRNAHECKENLITAKTAINNLVKCACTQNASDELAKAGLALDNFEEEVLKHCISKL